MNNGDEFYTAAYIKEALSISTLVVFMYRPIGEDVLNEIAACGIRKIELIQSPEQFNMADAGSMAHIGRVCRSCGIQIRAYHAHMTRFWDLDTEAKRVERVDLCKRQIDTMLELGGKVWGSHAGAADAVLFKCYRELARHVEGTDAVIAVENFPREESAVKSRMTFLDEIDHPKVGMILDIGHERDEDDNNPICLPGGASKVIDMCGTRLCYVHLHGFKDGKDHFPPLVEGDTIQWVELFRALHAAGYSGDLNFEPAGGRARGECLQAVADFPDRLVAMAAQSRTAATCR